jgi:FtsH-binding integral membrane protein
MLQVYNKMGIALVISGVISFLVSNSPAIMNAIFSTPLKYVSLFAPLGFVMYFGAKINKVSAATAQTYLWIFASIMGVSLAPIFVIYTGSSIAKVFFISASLFGSMSLYGYTTKRDLTGMGSFLMMGLIGIILASLVNMFLKSSALEFAISIIGVLIFTGLTAYDSQKIKNMYQQVAGNAESLSKAATIGALSLYMDFINLFIMLLRLFGNRR